MARHEGKTHPQDWAELFGRHTSYEWAIQIAVDKIDPVGERRDDIRIGWLAAVMMAMNSTERKSMRELKSYAESFTHYLRFMHPDEDDE